MDSTTRAALGITILTSVFMTLVLVACGGSSEDAVTPGAATEVDEVSTSEAAMPAQSTKTLSIGTIITVVGTGEPGFSGDGGHATEAQLEEPISLSFDPAGNLYIGEVKNNVVRKVDSDGLVTTVAGTGVFGYSGDGGPATRADINDPDLGFDEEGNLHVLQFRQQALRKIDSAGVITTIAGTGQSGLLPEDGSRANDSNLCRLPAGPAFDDDGSIYISCEDWSAVIKIDSKGIISTVAGTGEPGFAGDGGPAIEAQLGAPTGISIDPEGNLFIADVSDHRIRKVDRNGIITTVAGTGTRGYSGDGGPATVAELSEPIAVAVGAGGEIYFSSFGNDVVRKVDTEGIISTVAGTGEQGFSGDGGPAVEAKLNGPSDVILDTEGNLYISDWRNHRVRQVILSGSMSDDATP